MALLLYCVFPFQIEISCQATGQPAPAVELRLYSVGGPDLAGSAKYKVRLFNTSF